MSGLYYTKNIEGGICAWAENRRAFAYLPENEVFKTEREIVTGRDGGLYFAGEEPEPPLDELVKEYENRVQERLDAFARTLTYDGMLSACTYATSLVEMYRIEGQYCVEARDATWHKAFQLLNAFTPGDPIPSWEEIEAELPPLAWPKGSRGYREPENG